MTHRTCNQTQCVFNAKIKGGVFPGCRHCAECNAEPNVIKTDCSVCLACENIPEMQRWDDGSKGVNPAVKEKVMVMNDG